MKNYAVTFLIILAIFPAICSALFESIFTQVHFPISHKSTAEAIFPRLHYVSGFLSEMTSEREAGRFSILYANVFFYNGIFLITILFTHAVLVLRPAIKRNRKNNTYTDCSRISMRDRKPFLKASFIFPLVFLLCMVFFIPMIVRPSSGISISKAVDAQYGIIQAGFSLLNACVYLNFLLFISEVSSRKLDQSPKRIDESATRT